MKKAKAVLIIGGSGFVGTHLSLYLRNNYKVFSAFYKNPQIIPGTTPVQFDVLDEDMIRRLIFRLRPAVIIYAAGNHSVQWTEDNNRIADQIHAGGPANVLGSADILKPRFIYLSSCYIFDGNKGNYSEEATVISSRALGRSKASAENFIRGKSLNHVIVRSSPLYGRGRVGHPTWFDQIRVNLSRGTPFELPTTELHSYAPVAGLCELVERLIEGGPRNKVLHYGGLTKVTQFDFARAFAKHFDLDPSLVIPQATNNYGFNFPTMKYDYSLNSSMAASLLKVNPFLLEDGFDLLKKQFSSGSSALSISA